MSKPVFFVPSEALTRPMCRVDGDEGRHAATVKRLRVGEAIDLCDGQGVRASATITSVDRDAIDVKILSVVTESEDPVRFVVVQALAKGDRADLAIEMLTELGAAEIYPWNAQHSVAKWDDEKTQVKWQRIAREASKQSRRSWVPVVHDVLSTAAVATLIADAQLALVLHEGATQALADVPVPVRGDVVVIVGPEGGLSAAEVDQFSAAGARVVRMGRTVLRTSTAGAAALAAMGSRTAAWGARMSS